MRAQDQLLKMVGEWSDFITDSREAGRYHRIFDQLKFLARVKFQPFVPTLYSQHPISFEERLLRWLRNNRLAPEQTRNLFEFAARIAFFSFDDFTALFRSAFSGPITRWCMNQAGLGMDDSEWQTRLDEERFHRTWFCPVTDSLLISVFHHVNGIEDKAKKPSFFDLHEFGDPTKVREHAKAKGYQRIVLLEDFVGTGGQAESSIRWAHDFLKMPILFCPMITTNEAVSKYEKLKTEHGSMFPDQPRLQNFDICPIHILSSDCFVHDVAVEPEPLFARIGELARLIHGRLDTDRPRHSKEGSLGWWNENSPQKGAAAVLFSNTPNSSLPLIHRECENWTPLFPRVARQPL